MRAARQHQLFPEAPLVLVRVELRFAGRLGLGDGRLHFVLVKV